MGADLTCFMSALAFLSIDLSRSVACSKSARLTSEGREPVLVALLGLSRLDPDSGFEGLLPYSHLLHQHQLMCEGCQI